MDALVALLKDALTSQPILQIFAGAAALIVIAFMVMRAQGDKAHAVGPAPTSHPLHEVPAIFAQGPRELLDLLREQRDMDRRRTEDSSHIRDCVRAIRDETKKQTEILDEIRDDQRLEHKMNSERERRRPA